MEIPFELLHELPKTDLHVHLDGCLRIPTLIDIAREQQVELPTTDREKLSEIVMSGKHCKNLAEYLAGFDLTLSVMQEPKALHRIAYELAEDAAAENVWYMEVRFSPILHTRKGLKLSTILESVKY
jgi:adenosine deaminase